MTNRVQLQAETTGPAPAPVLTRMHAFFEAQAARTPEACALLYAGDQWTYRALDTRANRLAAQLRDFGVGPEVIVGVCLERSPAAIVSLLAILKAGGAYLPLDPSYPAERLAYMLADSRAPLLITEPTVPFQDAPANCRVLSFAALEQGLGPPDDLAADAPSADDPLAYVIYTSGSTGRPKGVAVPHAPPCNLLRWHARALPLKSGDRVLQFAPLSFDASVQEVFATLGAGGTLVLIDEEMRRDPRSLRRFLGEQEIARVYLTPVMLYRLAELPGPPLPRLRDVIAAGEQLRITPAVVRFFTEDVDAALHNQYGPTETTVITTSHTLAGPPAAWPALPPVGHTLDGVKALLLDEAGQPVPAGQPGQLYFGGACVSRGYLHDETLTRARFLPDPADPAARIYRSGDLAQQLPDGAWHFLGRVDDQVKIRGFRIELGEIETVLSRHVAIEQAAVAASEPMAGGDRELLAGYLLRAGVPAPSTADLKAWLHSHLPDYFVPARLTPLSRLPLTPSGKVDRRALVLACRQEVAFSVNQPPTALPANLLEASILAIWREVLGREQIGVEDNFFDAGGNSISAARAHLRICEKLSVEFPLTVCFQKPTIRALAAHFGDQPKTDVDIPGDVRERARRQQQAFARPPSRPALR